MPWAAAGLAVALGLARCRPAPKASTASSGPMARVTFSDKPPPASRCPASGAPPAAPPQPNAGAQLPFELRQVVGRYPVTLYTSKRLRTLRQRAQPAQCARHSIHREDCQHSGRRRSAQAPERRQLAAVSDHRRPADQGLLGHRMDAVPGRGRLPQDVGTARQLPSPGPHAAGGRRARTRQHHAPIAAQPQRLRAPPTNVPVAPPINNPAGIRF